MLGTLCVRFMTFSLVEYVFCSWTGASNSKLNLELRDLGRVTTHHIGSLACWDVSLFMFNGHERQRQKHLVLN